MKSGKETLRFLPNGALSIEVAKVKAMPRLATISAAFEDQSQTTFGDIFWVVRNDIINLGAVAMATHVRDLGVGKVDAYYPFMRGQRIEQPYDLIGLSCSEVSVGACLLRIAELRKKVGAGPLIVVGGPGMDAWWKQLLAAGADTVVFGDGQYPLTQLLGVVLPLMDGGAASLKEAFAAAVKNDDILAVRDLAFAGAGGSVQRTPPQGFVRDLDEYAAVDYALIRGRASSSIKCVHHSSGCVYNCEFCSSIVNQRHCYRQVSVARLIADCVKAEGEGFKELFLASDLFLPGNAGHNRRILEEIVAERKARGLTIKMSSQTTVSSLHNLIFRNAGTPEQPLWEEDPDNVRLLLDAGMYRWSLGVEAFTDEERARLGKDPRQSGSDAARTLRALCKHGMLVHAMMMVHEDTPYERAVQIGNIVAEIGVGTVQFFHPVPAPQTPWGEQMYKRSDFVIGKLGSEVLGASRCTGEYVVAANRPAQAIVAVETCYDTFTSAANILADLGKGRISNAAFKLGMRFLILARRYLVPQYYRYTEGILSGNYSYWKPEDGFPAGEALGTLGGMWPNFTVYGLLRHHRKKARMRLAVAETSLSVVAEAGPAGAAAPPAP